MASYIWSGATGGNWSDPANWTPNGVPGSDDLALVNLAGSYAIALDVAEIGSLTLDSAGVTVTPNGPLKLDGTLDVKAGTLTVAHTIQGGTLVADDGTIDYAGGTLDGVTLSGPLDLSAAGSSLTIEGGIGFTGPGPEQILETGAGSTLTVSGFQTLDDVAVTIDNSAATALGGLALDANSSLVANGATLTDDGILDNKGTISLTNTTLAGNGTIENEGTLSLNADRFSLSGISSLTNTGTVNFSGGSTVSINRLTNTGGITIAQDAHVTVNDFPGDSFSNAGTITVDPTGTLELNDGNYTLADLDSIANHGGTVLIDGALDLGGATIDLTADNPGLSGFKLNDATLENGTIKTDGTGLYYTNDFNTLSNVTIDGPLNVDGGANTGLAIDSNSGFAAGSPVQITETAGSYLEFDGSRTLSDASLTLDNASFFAAGLQGPSSGGTLTLDAKSVLTLIGNDTFGSLTSSAYALSGILNNEGTIVAKAGGLTDNPNPSIGGPLFENEGLFIQGGGYGSDFYQLSNFGLVSLSGMGSSILAEILDNTGTVDISNGSNLTISAGQVSFGVAGQFDNTGTVQLSGGSTLTLQAGSTELGTVSFLDGTGTLTLYVGDEFVHYGHGSTDGTLNMFQSGDVLDLGPAFNDAIHHFPGDYSIAHSGNTLTVDQGGILVDSFALTGQDYSNAAFTLTGDVITTDAPCFCAGTLILTDRGERAVEALEVGELVVTLEDGLRRLMAIRWLGRRRVVVAQHAEAEHVDPVHIARDAIAPGLPVRDLFVSPDHALFLDGMLIQARQLVNHMTITRDSGRAVVTYHHVELDRHAVLIADGMACESYLDGGNRGRFDVQGSVVALHPPVVGDARPCAPLVTDAALVQPVWQRLALRAQVMGHVERTVEFGADTLPWLETADGTRLPPQDGGLVFALPPGCLRVRLRSASDRPTTLAPWSDDRRRLGVAIGALAVRRGALRQDLPLVGLRGDTGWWPLETAGDLAWRWTDGDGWIDLPEATEAIEVALHAVMTVADRRPAEAALPALGLTG